MNPAPAVHLVVRVWLEPRTGAAPLWRAAVIDTQTREKQYFGSPEALLTYLREVTSAPTAPETRQGGGGDGHG